MLTGYKESEENRSSVPSPQHGGNAMPTEEEDEREMSSTEAFRDLVESQIDGDEPEDEQEPD